MEIRTKYIDDYSIDPYFNLDIEEINECPRCHFSIAPAIEHSVITLESDVCRGTTRTLNVMFICPKCKQSFLATYDVEFYPANPYNEWSEARYETSLSNVFPQTPLSVKFDSVILDVSPKFVQIYNEALYAESLELFEIAGPGYRKALEFLIKDYLISLDPNSKEDIEKMPLGNCAKKLKNDTINRFFEKLVWVGNDQVHYLTKHTQFTIRDLKNLINAAVVWITAIITMRNHDQSLT